MPMINNAQAVANDPVSFTMDKDQVKLISKVSSDSFYSQESNWHRVSFIFKHSTSSKRLVASFTNFSATKNVKLKQSMVGGESYELKKVIISKADRSHLVVKENEIPSVNSFGFSLKSAQPATIPNLLFTRDFSIADQSSVFDEYIELSTITGGKLVTNSNTNNMAYWFKPKSVTQTTQVKVRVYFEPSSVVPGATVVTNWRNELLVTNPTGTFGITSQQISNGYLEFNAALVDANAAFNQWPFFSTAQAPGFSINKIEIGSI